MKNHATNIELIFIFLFLLASCAPELMKVTTTKNGASVSTVMPYDLKFKRSVKDSVNVKVEILKNQ